MESILEKLNNNFNEILEYINADGYPVGSSFVLLVSKTPTEFNQKVYPLIYEFQDLLEDAEVFFDKDEWKNKKVIWTKRLSKINLVVNNTYRNKNFTEEIFASYNDFKRAKIDVRAILLKSLKSDPLRDNRGRKFVWKGDQRQLMELFTQLIDKGWIENDYRGSKEIVALPIIESFNISKNSQIQAINEASFLKVWRDVFGGDSKSKMPQEYISVFDNIIINSK